MTEIALTYIICIRILLSASSEHSRYGPLKRRRIKSRLYCPMLHALCLNFRIPHSEFHILLQSHEFGCDIFHYLVGSGKNRHDLRVPPGSYEGAVLHGTEITTQV